MLTRSRWFKCGRMFYTENTPSALEEATAGSADTSPQEPRQHLEMQPKQPDGHLMRPARVEKEPAPEAAASPHLTKSHLWGWGTRVSGERPDFSSFQKRSLSLPTSCVSSTTKQASSGPVLCLLSASWLGHPQHCMSRLYLDLISRSSFYCHGCYKAFHTH